ncbi:MAG: hypothetical protein J0L92_36135 [Deltaproteobacteria bacterium]|nr:hypothetical protein [Deltaproteobacteria bacterium]
MEGELPTSSVSTDRALAASVEAFSRALDAALPPPRDGARGEEACGDDVVRSELAAECATVLDAFSRAVDPISVREAMALAGLLARRTAELGASGILLSAVVEALLAVVGPELAENEGRALRGVMIEGYAAARLEHDRDRDRALRARVTRPFVIAPRCVALALQGLAEPDWIAAAVEGIGPLLLHSDARAVIVWVSFADDASDAAIAELSSLIDIAGVVGARVVFGATGAVAPVLRAHVGDRALVVTDDAATAFADALALASTSPTEAMRARVAGLLKRLGV